MNSAQLSATHPAPRVAFVCGAIHEGGTTTFLVNLAGELVRRQVPVAVFSAEKDNPHKSDFDSLGIPTVVQDHHREIYEDRIRATLMAVRDYSPSVVVASHSSAPWEVLRYLPRGLRRVGTVQIHHPGIYESLRPYASCVDAMVCVSKEICAKVKSLPEFAAAPVHCIHYGVPMPATTTPRALTNEPLRLLYLGRLERPQKRTHLFPKILEDLTSAGIPFHWTIAGTGPEAHNLQTNLKTTRTDQHVSLVGKVPYAKVPELLQQHDVFLLASVAEGLPLSLVEAMGAGLVPVVSDLESGIREVVDEANGILVPVDDLAGYAKAIVFLHEHRERLHSMSAAARVRVREHFSIPSMTDQWMPLLSDAPVPGIAWPNRWDIQAPLTCPGSFRFSRPARVLRRLTKRLGL